LGIRSVPRDRDRRDLQRRDPNGRLGRLLGRRHVFPPLFPPPRR